MSWHFEAINLSTTSQQIHLDTITLPNFNGSNLIFENNVGNIGIGTTAPASLLHVAGQIYCTSVVTSSDERLKRDIEPADLIGCYDLVKNIPLKYYKWNTEIFNAPITSNDTRMGWLAQDIEQLLPNCVENIDAYGISDCKTINLDQIIAVMYGTIQELQRRVEYLETQLQVNTASSVFNSR